MYTIEQKINNREEKYAFGLACKKPEVTNVDESVELYRHTVKIQRVISDTIDIN